MFHNCMSFDGTFYEDCQETLPNMLLALVTIILEDSNLKGQTNGHSQPTAFSVVQLLKFNSVKQQIQMASSVRQC